MQVESDKEVTIKDDFTHSGKRVGTCTIKLKLGNSIQLFGMLYVSSIKRNLIPISAIEDDGYRVTFIEGKVQAWPKMKRFILELPYEIWNYCSSLLHVVFFVTLFSIFPTTSRSMLQVVLSCASSSLVVCSR